MKEMIKSFGSLKAIFPVALILIYTLLASVFRSYWQPFMVMSIIPFALVGAIVGHWVTGFEFMLLSWIGFVALAGIVVNDSLVLVDFINRYRKDHPEAPIFQAVVASGRARLRAILLTSITTIFGLLPLLLERSLQARFLIPMGVSISFGLAFTTLLTLFGVPCLYLMLGDLRRLLGLPDRPPARADEDA